MKPCPAFRPVHGRDGRCRSFQALQHNYGHDAGDHVLRLVARACQARVGGTAYRYGQEFALVFPGKARMSASRSEECANRRNQRFTMRRRPSAGQPKNDKERRASGNHDKVSSVWRNGTTDTVARSGLQAATRLLRAKEQDETGSLPDPSFLPMCPAALRGRKALRRSHCSSTELRSRCD